MTYCCGILVRDGLVMIADTRTNAGLDNISTFRKLHVFRKPGERVITAGQYKVQDGSLVADPRAAHTAQAETGAAVLSAEAKP